MVGAVAEVVEASFCISKKSAGSGAHAVTIGAFDDMGCGGEGGSAYRIVFRTGPEAEYDEIGHLLSPPFVGYRLGLGDQLNGAVQGIFWMSGGVTNKASVMAKLAESSNGKTEISVPPARS
ncbi:hypothetical protein EBS57_09710, partial [bacterium]|nr:hypothetical protein [bacterium]